MKEKYQFRWSELQKVDKILQEMDMNDASYIPVLYLFEINKIEELVKHK